MRPYVFTAFHLQSHFPQHLLRHHPGALDPEKVDEVFVREVCDLNRDSSFFMGAMDHDASVLHPYLTKYVTMYFDHEFGGGEWEDALHEFAKKSRSSRRVLSPSAAKMSREEACRVLGISVAEWKTMDRKDVVRLYRKKAKKAHPDKGGDHDAFVRMREAYECLVSWKREPGEK